MLNSTSFKPESIDKCKLNFYHNQITLTGNEAYCKCYGGAEQGGIQGDKYLGREKYKKCRSENLDINHISKNVKLYDNDNIFVLETIPINGRDYRLEPLRLTFQEIVNIYVYKVNYVSPQPRITKNDELYSIIDESTGGFVGKIEIEKGTSKFKSNVTDAENNIDSNKLIAIYLNL